MINSPRWITICSILFPSFCLITLMVSVQRFFFFSFSNSTTSCILSTPHTKQIHSTFSPTTSLLKLQTLKFVASLATSSGSKQNKIPMEQSKRPEASAASKGLSDDILPHILNLYSSPAARDFEIYAPNATFEDPLMCGHGVKQIKSAFYSLPKVFSESRITEYTVQENLVEPGKGEILIDNKQHYKIWGKDVTMISLIKLQVENGKVVRHEDRWDKKPLRNRDTVKLPLLGRVVEITRRGSMFLTHALMRFGKDPTP